MSLNQATILIARKLVIMTFAFILTGLVLLLSGCGGSTSGTGGITVSGRVLNESDAPIPGVTVTLLQTGAQTESAADGGFALISPVAGELDIKFESDAVNAQAKITSVPEDAERVTATFTVRENGQRVDAGDVQIRRKQRDPVRDDSDDDDDDSDDDRGDSDDDSNGDDDSDDDSGKDEDGDDSSGNDDSDDNDDDSGNDDDGDSSGGDDSEDGDSGDDDNEDDDEEEGGGGSGGSGNSGSGGHGDDD